MSVEAMAWAIRQQLPAREKLILFCLSDVASSEGFLMPPIVVLEQKTGLGRVEINLSIKSLMDLDLIRKNEEIIDNRPVYQMVMR
nr:MAG TPA: hypothetical protein [Caudoviricetes sp.]